MVIASAGSAFFRFLQSVDHQWSLDTHNGSSGNWPEPCRLKVEELKTQCHTPTDKLDQLPNNSENLKKK